MKKILIVGATSAIAESTARLWALQGARLFLLGRNEERLHVMSADLKVRGAESVQFAMLDVNDFAQHEPVIEVAAKALDGIEIVLVAHGSLGNQKTCENDIATTLKEINTNTLSVISLLTLLATRFEAQKYGTIAVISSVAGDRGRQSNYIYGAAKGAITIFTQGLRQRMHKHGVQVLTIKPGFVDTPMTIGFKKGLLWVKPERIALGITRAIEKRSDVVYLPWFWEPIMIAIKIIPERFFKKIKL